MKIRCIVVEDEPLATKKMTGFIAKLSYLELCATFDNAIEAIGYLGLHPVDLVFLDIRMEGFSGIRFLESLQQHPRVILTTAYDQYALKGYEFDVTDYLLKPFTFDRFVQATGKVQQYFAEKAEPSPFIFVKTAHRLEKIVVADILYIEGMSEYLRIVTPDKKIMTLQNFKAMEEVLPQGAFVRVHKSFMVAIARIDHIEKNTLQVKDKMIPVSETYKDDLLNRIGVSRKKEL